MGAVQIDVHKEDKIYKNVTLSNIETIYGLIRFRSKIDKYFNIKQNYNAYEAGDCFSEISEELLCLYLDLDNIINSLNFNEKELFIINKLSEEWTKEEIANSLGDTKQNISKVIKTICKKIKLENDERWFDNMYLNYIKSPWNYKKCSKCKEIKPATEKYFRKQVDCKDGLRPDCKKCESSAKKS